MAKAKKKQPAVEAKVQADESERALGRAVAVGLPTVTVVASIAIGMVTSMGPALLVLAAGILLGTIAFLWASVRTLSGDAPLPEDLAVVAVRVDGRGALAEKKKTILRALKDLEHERAVGKIDETDYQEISASYREQAKEVMRQLDAELEPLRERAEALAKEHLGKKGIGEAPAEDKDEFAEITRRVERPQCARCATENDFDAEFCKKCGLKLGERTGVA